jgi:hypothetical protein
MSRWLGRSRALTFVLVCWAVGAAVVALWDLTSAVVVCMAGVACSVVGSCLAERQWWKATASAALFGSLTLNLITPSNSSQVEHDVVFGVGLAGVAYFVSVFAADSRVRNRRGKPPPETGAPRQMS